MTFTRRDFAAFGLATLGLAVTKAGAARAAAARNALVIAPGVGNAELPEATAGAFELAIREGADFLAADFTPTRDRVLVALPDHELSALTDVARRPDFADRKQTRNLEGEDRTGWFAEDFTLAELKTLVRVAPPPARRRGGKAAPHAILTFEEIVAAARAGSVRTARVIGVHAGFGRASYFAGLDLAVEPLLASAIRVAGYDSPAAAMFVRGGDPGSLKTLGEMTRVRRVVGLGPKDDASPDGLKAIRGYAEVVAPVPSLLLDLSHPKKPQLTSLVADAHAAGLAVHAWTLGTAFPPPPLAPSDSGRLLAALYMSDVEAVAGSPAAAVARAHAEAVAHTKH